MTQCCKLCGSRLPDEYPDYMEHFLRKHRKNKRVRQWMAKAPITHRCEGCDREFDWRGELRMQRGTFYAPSYCEKCSLKDPVNPIFVTPLTLEVESR